MKIITTSLVLLSAVCLGGTSSKNKDFSFVQTNSNTTAAHQNTQQFVENTLFGKYLFQTTLPSTVSGPVKGEQAELWEPVSEIEDGAVYMIRCAENHDLYWDLNGGSLNNGTDVQLYYLTYAYAQKFYFKKSFDVNGNTTYQLSPLYEYSKVLRFANKTENSVLRISDEQYNFIDHDYSLYSDRIYFSPSVNPTRFYAHTCFANHSNSGNTYVSVQSASPGEKVKIKDSSLPSNRFIYSWELIKTDYLGLQVGNKTYINGTEESRYVVRVPYTGRYIIETRPYGGNSLDTYLVLENDSTHSVVDFNDDAGEGLNAKIVYDFKTTEEHSVYVNAFNDNYHGYCYLILRPEKTVYLTGTYDYDSDSAGGMATPFSKTADNLRKMGYFPIAQVNLNHESVFNEIDWEGTIKMNRDIYIFSGHGWDSIHAGYYDGPNCDWVRASDYNNAISWPNLSKLKLAVWMACGAANEDVVSGNDHCLARFAAMKGAEISIGFRGNVNKRAYTEFLDVFFQRRKNKSIESIEFSFKMAAQQVMLGYDDKGGMQYPSLFKDGGHTEIRFTIKGPKQEDIKTEIVPW